MAKEIPSSHEVRLTLSDTNPVFLYLGMKRTFTSFFDSFQPSDTFHIETSLYLKCNSLYMVSI